MLSLLWGHWSGQQFCPSGSVRMHIIKRLIFKTEHDTSGEILSDHFKAEPLKKSLWRAWKYAIGVVAMSQALEPLNPSGGAPTAETSPNLRAGEGMLLQQGAQPDWAHLPPGHQTTSSCWKISPSLFPSMNRLVSTAPLSLSHYLFPCGQAEAGTISGEFLDENTEALSLQTKLSAGLCSSQGLPHTSIPPAQHRCMHEVSPRPSATQYCGWLPLSPVGREGELNNWCHSVCFSFLQHSFKD